MALKNISDGGSRSGIAAKPSQTLEERRLQAAEASGGASLGVIYERLMDIVQIGRAHV